MTRAASVARPPQRNGEKVVVKDHMQSNRQQNTQNHSHLLWQRRPLLREMASALDRARPARRRPAFQHGTRAGGGGRRGQRGSLLLGPGMSRKRVISLQGIRLTGSFVWDLS